MSEPADNAKVSTPTRVRVAQLLALAALLGALVGALGPAERVGTSYAWPPRVLPEAQPHEAWYTPLLLVTHRPQALVARIPCVLPPPLPGAARPVEVLASARDPERAGALSVRREGANLRLAVGEGVLARVPLSSASAREGCAYELGMQDERWSLVGGPRGISRSGELAAMPVVFGLFSGLDLRRGGRPQVEVLTAVHETRTIPRQALAWTLAALALLASLALVAFERPPRPGAALRRAGRALREHAHPVDAVVAVVLLVWWVLAPAAFDDGWIYAKQSTFEFSRGFSTYFGMLGTNAPLGYWLDWLQHWVTQDTTALLYLRLPALGCLAATWVLSRVVLARILSASVGPSAAALWSLASAFLVGALAWGMTVRPEPMTAFLVTGVLACTVLFLERRETAPLAVACLLVPLAITAHPAGLVALAPLLAIVRTLISWVRGHVAAATTLVAASCALLMLLVFVGSDFEQRRADGRSIRTYGVFREWHDELARYELLADFPYATPLRRLAVVFIGLAVLQFALRLRGRPRTLLDHPSTVLALSLVLLIPNPSKWPWHFGALLGVGALAVACEAAHVRDLQSSSRRASVVPLVAAGVALVAGLWAWDTRESWNLVDLRTFDWWPAVAGDLGLNELAMVASLVLFAGALVVARRRGGASFAAAWITPLLAGPAILITASLLAADTARTSAWTLGRQNLGSIGGDPGCGLADALVVSPPTTARQPAAAGTAATDPLARRLTEAGARSLVHPDLVPYFPCAQLPRLGEGVAEVPRYLIAAGHPVLPRAYRLSPFEGASDLYEVRPLSIAESPDPPERVFVFEFQERIPGVAEARPDVRRP